MIDHRAILDELVKIGEDAGQQSAGRDRLVQALKTVGIAALGSAAGYGTAGLLEQAFPKFMHAAKPVRPGYVKAVQIGLPILGALGLSLGSKYRQMVDQGLTGNTTSNDRRTQ